MRTQPAPAHVGLFIGVAATLGAALVTVAGCGSSTDPAPPAECGEETAPELPSSSAEPVRGSVSVVDTQDFTLDDMGKPRGALEGRVVATFADFRTVTSTPSGLVAVGSTCLGVASRPVSSGQPARLDLARVTLGGTALGEVALNRSGAGVFALTNASSLLMPGASALHVVGETTGGGFPAFDVTIPAASKLELLAPPKEGTANLLVDDVAVLWTPGDGAWVEITILPDLDDSSSGGGQVTCITADDGCFTVPASASTFLLASRAATYTLAVERHQAARATPASDVVVNVSAVSAARVTLVNGVLGP